MTSVGSRPRLSIFCAPTLTPTINEARLLSSTVLVKVAYSQNGFHSGSNLPKNVPNLLFGWILRIILDTFFGRLVPTL